MAGLTALETMQSGARAVLVAGGTTNGGGPCSIRRLEKRMLADNASPGGAADLLAATLFLDRIAWREPDTAINVNIHYLRGVMEHFEFTFPGSKHR